MKRFNEIAKFAENNPNSKKLVLLAEDYAKHDMNDKFGKKYDIDTKYSKQDKLKRINEVFIEELATRSGIKLSSYDNDFYEYSQNPNVVAMEQFLRKVMVDASTPIIMDSSILSMLATFHYGGYGDTFEVVMTDKSLFQPSEFGRRNKHTESKRREKSSKTIALHQYGLTSITNLPEILKGESMIMEDIMIMGMSMNRYIYKLVLKEFLEKANAITDTRYKLGSYDEIEWMKRLKLVSAKNNKKAIVGGDAIALKSLLPNGQNQRIFLQDEFNTTLGYMETFNAYNVMGFDAIEDDSEPDGLLGFPEDKLYGFSPDAKFIHVAIGATMTNMDGEWDNDDLSQRATLRKELGVRLITTEKVAVCDLA